MQDIKITEDYVPGLISMKGVKQLLKDYVDNVIPLDNPDCRNTPFDLRVSVSPVDLLCDVIKVLRIEESVVIVAFVYIVRYCEAMPVDQNTLLHVAILALGAAEKMENDERRNPIRDRIGMDTNLYNKLEKVFYTDIGFRMYSFFLLNL